jgi:energy-coupling factor transporter ATP-binding protein EcfA2
MAFGLKLRKMPRVQINQRVMDGAIVTQPKAFLFYEPLSNLDAKIRAELKNLHQRFKTTTVYVTHDQEEAMTLGNRDVWLYQGSLFIRQLGIWLRPCSLISANLEIFIYVPRILPTDNVEGAIHSLIHKNNLSGFDDEYIVNVEILNIHYHLRALAEPVHRRRFLIPVWTQYRY